MIEMVGVLAVVVILAALLSPVVVRRADIAAVNAETANLTTISNALVLQILRSNSIPSEAAWFQAVGNWLSYAPSTVTNNARRYARAYLVDSSGWLGTNLPASGYYLQSVAGTTAPGSARLMVVSSLSASLPVSSGRPGAAIFNDIWNTAPKAIPANAIWSGWKGRADDLLIQRINLQPLFSQLVLVNRDTNNAAAYAVAGRTNLVMSRSISNAYYFDGTVVGLGSTNSGSTLFQTSYVLNRNISYVFENGYWRTQIGTGPNNLLSTNVPVGMSFNSIAQTFVSLPENPNAGGDSAKGGDQQQVLSAMANFMLLYQLWANNPHGQFTTYNIGAGANYDAMFSYLQSTMSILGQVAGWGKDPNDISGLLQ
jgi:type II secretory pathway pseudopilin PulG